MRRYLAIALPVALSLGFGLLCSACLWINWMRDHGQTVGDAFHGRVEESWAVLFDLAVTGAMVGIGVGTVLALYVNRKKPD
jgi:hypothetical protein